MASFAAALSEHPLATHATGEVVGQVMDTLGERPTVAVLTVAASHAGAIDDIAAAVMATLEPDVLVGAAAVAVIGNAREVEEAPAVSLWAGLIDGARGVRLSALRSADGWIIDGMGDHAPDDTLIVVNDPFSFPVEGLVAHLGVAAPDLRMIGGMASAAARPGGNRLVMGSAVHHDGAVGVLVPEGTTRTIVSQGCRPVGEPFTVTRADHNLVHELGGRPAIERLEALVADADPDTQELLRQGIHVGLVVNEQQMEFRRGDFLIRGVVGVDRTTGSVAVGDRVDVGQTLQFQVRDAATADEDLRELMAGQSGNGALVFTCNGRGRHLFDEPDHDAAVISDALDGAPVGGMFCAGEIGPVGNRNHLHGFTASVAIF